MAKRKHKRRTHVRDEIEGTNIPKSMVIKMSDPKRRPTKALGQLVKDFRNIMQPHTAARLKERKGNRLKDYLVMAGPLGVTHFFLFSQSSKGHTTLRIGRTPRGPTLYFRVDEYSLCRDIQRTQSRPHALNRELQHPPVLVMNNFKADRTSDKDALLTSMFQNMLPSIQVDNDTQLSSVSRCLLIERDPETDQIVIRHYAVVTRAVGSSRAIKKLAAAHRGHKEVPNLGDFNDVSEYVADPGASESEGEDEVLPDSSRMRTAVKLVEVGPRLKLTLTKIEDGLCDGKTLYHVNEKRSDKEAKKLEDRHRQRDNERERRRKAQEANVLRKREAAGEKTTRAERGKARAEARAAEGGSGSGGEQESDSDMSDSEMQDVSQMNDVELEAELAAAEMSSEESSSDE